MTIKNFISVNLINGANALINVNDISTVIDDVDNSGSMVNLLSGPQSTIRVKEKAIYIKSLIYDAQRK